MEAMLLAFDCLALFVLVFFSVKDDRRPPGTPSHGPFAYLENADQKNAPPPAKGRDVKPRQDRPHA